MTKDPAFLFYSNDFLSGTFTMTDEQVGKYIRLLCIQHQKGYLTDTDMKNICKTHDEDIYCKFIINNGKYYNERLKVEAEKRKQYSESRRNNRLSKEENKDLSLNNDKSYVKSYVKHMEDENENINEDIIINENENNGFNFEKLWKLYPNKDGKKQALTHMKSSIKTEIDYNNCITAIRNYLQSDKVQEGFVKNGSTFFNNWQDWIEFKGINNKQKLTGAEIVARNIFTK